MENNKKKLLNVIKKEFFPWEAKEGIYKMMVLVIETLLSFYSNPENVIQSEEDRKIIVNEFLEILGILDQSSLFEEMIFLPNISQEEREQYQSKSQELLIKAFSLVAEHMGEWWD